MPAIFTDHETYTALKERAKVGKVSASQLTSAIVREWLKSPRPVAVEKTVRRMVIEKENVTVS